MRPGVGHLRPSLAKQRRPTKAIDYWVDSLTLANDGVAKVRPSDELSPVQTRGDGPSVLQAAPRNGPPKDALM